MQRTVLVTSVANSPPRRFGVRGWWATLVLCACVGFCGWFLADSTPTFIRDGIAWAFYSPEYLQMPSKPIAPNVRVRPTENAISPASEAPPRSLPTIRKLRRRSSVAKANASEIESGTPKETGPGTDPFENERIAAGVPTYRHPLPGEPWIAGRGPLRAEPDRSAPVVRIFGASAHVRIIAIADGWVHVATINADEPSAEGYLIQNLLVAKWTAPPPRAPAANAE